jgi:nucleoside-diphosphate-sugar epimerase
MGAINMLGMAKRVGARILQASTSEVYGDPHVHPQTEDYFGNVNTIGLRSCYDEGKARRRNFVYGLSPAKSRRYQNRPHIQHLRSANAGERRARRL